MPIESVAAILIGIAGVIGGWWGGRKNSTLAITTANLLEQQVTALQREVSRIPDLLDRIALLEEMDTQRAAVEEVKKIVERIEARINA